MANYILSDFDEVSKKSESYSQIVALFLGYASAIAYKEEQEIKNILSSMGLSTNKESFCFLNQSNTQGFIVSNDKLIAVVFRGTESSNLHDWFTDLEIDFADNTEFAGGIKVHSGFYKALCSVYEALKNFLELPNNKGKAIWFTGHSLGGALATLAAFKLHHEGYENKILGLYTFGQPRVGNVIFAKRFDEKLGHKSYRLVNNNDIVPRIPPRCEPLCDANENYSHYKGQTIYFDKDGLLQSDMSFLEKIYDDVAGRLSNFIDAIINLDPRFSDGIHDHQIENYIACVKKPENSDNKPHIDYPL